MLCDLKRLKKFQSNGNGAQTADVDFFFNCYSIFYKVRVKI
jgi:hypothetical protein